MADLFEVRLSVGRSPVVADDPKHRLPVLVVLREGAHCGSHLGARCVRIAGQDRRERSGQRPSFGGIVGNPLTHQKGPEVGVAEPERSVVVRPLGDFFGREVSHCYRDFQHDRPQPDGVLVSLDIEGLSRVVVELDEVEAGQIAGRVVEEHVLGARV